jgi:hypothetical protein
MDILDSLFHDIRAINTHIHAQDAQLEKALKGYSTGKPSKTKSKPKLTKSRGALPVPSQRYSKAKLPTKGSMKRLPSSKSKVGLSKSKSTRIAVKKKPALPPVARSSRGGGASQALKFPQKPALPKNGARAAPKRALVAKDTSSGPSTQRVSHSHLAPAVKKPPTLTDSSPKLQLRSEFREHMAEIERMKELLSDSREEGEVLREVNGVVSLLLNKSQGYLAKADQSLRTADAQAPSHYKSIIRKLLDNQTKTTIVVSPKPTPRKVPIYKKAPIEYTDRSQRDLDELLQQHGDPAEGSRLGASGSGRAPFNFPDIFDRIYNKPVADGADGPTSSSGKAAKAPVGRQLEKDFDLSLFSPAKLIDRAQQSLTSAISSETIASLRRETAASMDVGGSSSSSQRPPLGRAPLKAEQDLDDLVREVLDSVDRHSQRITAAPPSSSSSSTAAATGAAPATPTRGALAVDTSYGDDSSHPPTATQMASSTRPAGDAYRLDDDLSLLTPSLFSPKPTAQRSSDEERQRDDDAELELIRSSHRSERERIHGQMQAMRSKLDSLLSSSASATAAGTAVAAADGAKDRGVDVERLLPKLVGPTSLQSKDDESKLTEHEDLLQKVMRALMKKTNKDKDGDVAADKDHKAERRASRRATKATGGSATGVSQPTAAAAPSSSSSSGGSAGAAPSSSSAPSLLLPVDQAKEASAATVEGGSAESKSDDRRQSVGKLVPVPPTGQRSSSSGHTPRSRKLNAAVSLSTMHEVDDEADDDSERTGHSSRRHKHTDSGKALFGSSRPTEKSLAAVEAVKERTKQFEKTRPTEVDMRF